MTLLREFLALSILFAAAVYGAQLVADEVTEVAVVAPAVEPTPATFMGELRVEEAFGDPRPLEDVQLQGTGSAGQEAQGGLQEPQTADQLQPNAGLDEFPSDLQ